MTARKPPSTAAAKRIAFVSTSAISLNQLMRGQLEFLRAHGVTLDIYSGGPQDELQEFRNRRIGRICYVPFRRQPHPLWDFICLVWLTILFSLRRYDVVVYSTPKALFLGSLAAFFTRQPRRIAWIRGRGYENFRGQKRKIYVAMDRLTFQLSHQVLFISHSLIAAYRADGMHLGIKGQVVGHGSSKGVDLEQFHPLPAQARFELRAELDLSPADFVIVVVGRIREDKGSREVLELSRRLADVPQLRMLMIGGIEEAAIRKEMKNHQGRLRWFAPTSDVQRFFQVADLHLFLSHREGFGNVAIEAAAVDVPTFAFNVVGVRDSVIDGVTGQLFAFGDLDTIEREIRAAAADSRSLKKKHSGARLAIAERFSQARVWQDYAEVFMGDSLAFDGGSP